MPLIISFQLSQPQRPVWWCDPDLIPKEPGPWSPCPWTEVSVSLHYTTIEQRSSKGTQITCVKKKNKKKTKKQKPTFFPQKGQKYDKQILKMNEGTPQDGRGVGGHGVHLSPWRHQEYTFRHRRSCRTLAESGQGSLTTGKDYIYIHARLGRTKEGGGKEEDEQLGLRPGTGELRVQVSVAQLDLALCNSMDCSPPGSCVHVIFQAAILGWVAIPFCRGSPQPKDWTWVSGIAEHSLPSQPSGGTEAGVKSPHGTRIWDSGKGFEAAGKCSGWSI